MRLLLVEDDKDLCDTMGIQLIQAGYGIDKCYTGGDALFYASHQTYDIILLDRMLPEINGLTILHTLRKRGISTPVIMATALDGLNDRIDGLDAGADDYVVKPFAIEELMARIRAITRRPGRLETNSSLRFSNLSLDVDRHELRRDNFTVPLSKRETALLEYFMRNANQILPRSLILSYIWGSESEVEDGNLDNYVYFLRRRLKSVGSKAQIKTVHGVGYRLEETNV